MPKRCECGRRALYSTKKNPHLRSDKNHDLCRRCYTRLIQREKAREQMQGNPTVGRIVHYQSYGTPNGEFKPAVRAAIITEVDTTVMVMEDGTTQETGRLTSKGEVGLCVLNPTGMFFNQHVPYSDVPKPGHWSWPPRV